MDSHFGSAEREVIVSAATRKGECKGLSPRDPARGLLAAIRRKLAPDAASRTLANGRLEALRRLTCACFESGGRPDKDIVREAITAGINSKQIAAINGLARHYRVGSWRHGRK